MYSTMFALSNQRYYVYGDSRKNSKQRTQTSWTFDNNSGLNGLFGSESDGSSEALYPIQTLGFLRFVGDSECAFSI